MRTNFLFNSNKTLILNAFGNSIFVFLKFFYIFYRITNFDLFLFFIFFAEIYRIVSQKQIRDPPEGDAFRPGNDPIIIKPTVPTDVRKQCCQWPPYSCPQSYYNYYTFIQKHAKSPCYDFLTLIFHFYSIRERNH